MKRAVQRLLPSRSQVQASTSSLKKSFKLDGINLIEDFYIELDEPHKTWAPGDTITGITVLVLKKNVTNVNLTLTLLGLIKIKPSNSTSSVRNKPTVLFQHTSFLYGYDPNEVSQQFGEDEPIVGLSQGEHRFPFEMKLPKKNIYTSISFEKGAISYSLRGSINHNQGVTPNNSSNSSPASHASHASLSPPLSIFPQVKNSIQQCEKTIQIIVPINVARIPRPQTKSAFLRISEKKLRKTLSSTSTINSNVTHSTVNSDHSNESAEISSSSASISQQHAPVKLSVDLNQSGYLKGELIPIKIKVTHYKPLQSSNGIIVTLTRICRVDNGPESPIQSFRKDLCQNIAPLYIDPETLSAEVNVSLRVPVDAFPTIIGSEIVSFQYYIEVLSNVSSKNVLPTGAAQSKNSNDTKFSHSVVFDIHSTADRELHNFDSGIINVDNLKRAKNFLGLNTEIIVGTERTKRHKTNIGKRTIEANARVNNQTDDVIAIENFDNSMVEEISQNSISPLSINGGILNVEDVNDTTLRNRVVSTGDLIDLPPQPETSGLSEKEVIRMKEEALLPSEPNYNHDSTSPAPSYSVRGGVDPAVPRINEHPGYSLVMLSNSNEDKDEITRRRLQEFESDPPEFDYVPEYNPAGQDRRTSSISTTLGRAPTITSTEVDTITSGENV